MKKELDIFDRVYHKVESIWKFDQETKLHIYGEYSNDIFKELQDLQWIFTEKIDGTNLRIIWDGYNLTYRGRTNRAQFSKQMIDYIEANLVNEAQEIIFEQTFKDKEVVLYGELYGYSIQKVGHLYNKDEFEFKAFDINIEGIMLRQRDMENLVHELGYETAPILLIAPLMRGLQYIRDNPNSKFSNAPLEGLIAKPLADLYNRLGKRIIVKLKPRDLEESINAKAENV